jgi:hypothetical protein
MDNMVYPFKESIIFTDSLTLFAIIFKLLSPILPENFQYFGLAGLLLYILNGGFAGLVVKKISGNVVISILGSLLFIFSVGIVWRMFGHITIALHFLILASIYICITKKGFRSTKRSVLLWCIVIVLALTLNMYYLGMTVFFIFFYALDECFEKREIATSSVVFIAPILVALFTLFLLGAFHLEHESSIGIGFFSGNLNAIFNSIATGYFLKELPLATGGQGEGIAYAGVGVLLAIFLALVVVISNFDNIRKQLSDRTILRRVILSFLTLAAFWLFALSNIVTINDKLLFKYNMPDIIERIWFIFRGTGRFMYPVVYLLTLFSLFAIIKWYSKRVTIILLSFLAILQYQDLNGFYLKRGDNYNSRVERKLSLAVPEWNSLTKDYTHIFFLTTEYIHGETPKLYEFVNLAVKNDLTLNDFYIPRFIPSVRELKNAEYQRIRDGNAAADHIYIVPEYMSFTDRELNLYRMDGVLLGLKNRYDYMEQYRIKEPAELNLALDNRVNFTEGFYGREGDSPENFFCWIKPEASVTLSHEGGTPKVIEIDYSAEIYNIDIPTKPTKIDVYINDVLASTVPVTHGGRDKIVINTTDNSEKYIIKIVTDGVYNPKRTGHSGDDRDLALRLYGIRVYNIE